MKKLLIVALLGMIALWPGAAEADGAMVSLPLVGAGTMDTSEVAPMPVEQVEVKRTIKLYAGDMRPRSAPVSVTELGCTSAYNWDWPSELELAARAGIDVWPLVQTTPGSVERIVAWGRKHPITHIMIENEPFNQKRMDADTTAQRIVDEILPRVDRRWPDATRVIGGFFIEYPNTYADIRAQVKTVVEAIQQASPRDNDVIAFHLYLRNTPAVNEGQAAADWFGSQVEQIAEDWPRFAITEWGVLYTSYSGKDVPVLSAYMQATWEIMQDHDCYAAAWYMAAGNEETSSLPDFILTNDDGSLKELGSVYQGLGASRALKD